jgi:8-oxo-dGTP pyrophosphatase MutT (NUDIX family)
MNLLAEIHYRPGLNIHGRTIYRTAVRGVILRGRDLLMVYSSNVGDYKFPGGGVGEGETHAQALCREVQEESGMSVLRVGSEIGAVIEYNTAIEKDYDAFKMTSHYYLCEVQGGFGEQKLDDYERDLGFQPVWIDIDRAIRLNHELLHTNDTVRWLDREIFILEYIRHTLLPPDT